MWYDTSIGNIIGGVAGTLLGLVAGGWGALAGISVPKGKRRKLVLNIAKVLMVIGAISLVVFGIAIFTGQPRHVWLTFLVIGAWPTVFLPFIYCGIKKAYTEAELKKMSVDDLM